MNKLLILTAIILFLSPSALFAAAGDLDTSFAATGFTDSRDVSAVAVQTDDKIVIGGFFDTVNGVRIYGAARLNADGLLDTNFNQGGIGINVNGIVRHILVQPDGKILIAGSFTTYNGVSRGRIARLNADGSLDTTFVPPSTGFNVDVYEMALQTDGKIVCVGDFTSYGATSRIRVARVNADGTIDAAFNPGTGASGGIVQSAAIQTDGNIIIGGAFTNYNGTAINRVARIFGAGANAGQLDGSLNVGTGANAQVLEVRIDAAGGVIIAGQFLSYNGNSVLRIARLDSAGAFDASFSSSINAVNKGANNDINAVKIDSSGMIYVAGIFTTFGGAAHNRYVRLFPGGTIDASFNPSIGTTTVSSLAFESSGKSIIVGNFSRLTAGEFRVNIARVNIDGTTDNSFEAAPGTSAVSSAPVNVIAVKNDGRILVGGDFDFSGRFAQFRLAQLNADGSIDTAFMSNAANSGANGEIFAITALPDGKILIGGNFTNYDNTTINHLARLNADGTLDNTFTVGTGANGDVLAVTLQTDGKILIGGSFTTYNGTARTRFACLNADGTLDTAFVTPTFSSTVNSIAVQTDGKILVGGNFTNFDASGINRFARLESSGIRDAGFNFGGSGTSGIVNSVTTEAGGTILIAGSFNSYNGTTKNNFARINSDGSPGTFSANINGAVNAVNVQPDGKIFIGGAFSTCNTVARARVCRLNNDGSLDASFDNDGLGANATVNAAALTASGAILIGGNFETYKIINRLHFAALSPGATIVWNGSVSSDWNTANNWTPAQVPTASDAVTIPTGALNFEPTLDSSRTLPSLAVLSGRTLSVPAGLVLTVSGLANSGTITGAGALSLSGTAANNGTISIAAANTSGTGTKQLGGTGAFVNNTFSIVGTATLLLTSSHQFSRLFNGSSSFLNAQNFTVRISGAGNAFGSGFSGSFTCNACTVEYNGTAAQTASNAADDYKFVNFNNPAGVTLTGSIGVDNGLILTAGTVTTGANEIFLDSPGSTISRTNGYVIGKLSRYISAGGENFTFAVGTANGYSPVQFNVTATGNANRKVTIETFQTNQPNLNAANSLARYWKITAGADISSANLVFNYLQTDVVGNENSYRISKVENGTPTSFPNDCAYGTPCVDTAANTATINNVTQFSDWTLSGVAPTAANAAISGSVKANNRGLAQTAVILTNAAGESRTILTNSFGKYKFTDVPAGSVYVVSVRHKQYRFQPQIISVQQDLTEVNFSANEK